MKGKKKRPCGPEPQLCTLASHRRFCQGRRTAVPPGAEEINHWRKFLTSRSHVSPNGPSSLRTTTVKKSKNCRAIPITGRGGPWGCEALRVPHYLDNRLTDGGKVGSIMCRPPFTPQEDSWYSFLLEVESTPRAIVWLETTTVTNTNINRNTRCCLCIAGQYSFH
jgi:hypothetical protein